MGGAAWQGSAYHTEKLQVPEFRAVDYPLRSHSISVYFGYGNGMTDD